MIAGDLNCLLIVSLPVENRLCGPPVTNPSKKLQTLLSNLRFEMALDPFVDEISILEESIVDEISLKQRIQNVKCF